MDQFIDLARWPGPIREGRRISIGAAQLGQMDKEEIALTIRLNLQPEPGEVITRYEVRDPWMHKWEIEDTW